MTANCTGGRMVTGWRSFKYLFTIARLHVEAGREHCINYGIGYEPTFLDGLRVALYDFLFNHIIYCHDYRSYIVWEHVKVPTIKESCALVIRLYTPREFRGMGIASALLDEIPHDNVLTYHKGVNCEEIGRVYKRYKDR